MALSGLDIYKQLPKTNCKDCGFPTCLAFAMKLAQKAVELDACPHVSAEAKAALAAAAQPPIRLVTIGTGDRKVEVGNETVLFRHEKTFFHQPGFVLRVKDTQAESEIEETAKTIAGYHVDRVGMTLALNGLAVENVSGDAATFARAAKAAASVDSGAVVLISRDVSAMEAAATQLAARKPLLYAADEGNWEPMAALAKRLGCPLAIRATSLQSAADLAEQVTKAGVADLVLDTGARGLLDSLEQLTLLRRLAIKKNVRLLGYPVITFPGEGARSAMEEAVLATQHVAKYGGVIVLDRFDPSVAYPLMTLRQNIFTDPQKPLQVEPGLFAVGEPNGDSPLFVTTNFSLTYFVASGEIEASSVSSWLLITDSDGLSVLTAWAAGKFDAERIAKAVKSFNVAEKVGHRKIIIPGAVATISGELEEELPDWEIRVGPREAVDISSYLKKTWN